MVNPRHKGLPSNIAHARSRRAGTRRAGLSAQDILSAPTAYINERRDAISKLQRQLTKQAATKTMSPLLRAESYDERIALVPGFDVDLREDIEKARFRDGQSGSGYVVVMGKPFKSTSSHATSSHFESSAPSAPRTTSPIRTTQSPEAQYTSPVCDDAHSLSPLHAAELHATVKVQVPHLSFDPETVAGAANRAVVRRAEGDTMHNSCMEDDLKDLADESLSPKVRVSMHPLDDGMGMHVSTADMYKNWASTSHHSDAKETPDISSREGLLTDEPSGASLYKSWAQAAHSHVEGH